MKLSKAIMTLVVFAMVLVFVAACGGGGGSGSSGSPTNAGSVNEVTEDPVEDADIPDDPPVNLLPLANAGLGKTVALGSLVTLYGSQSSDPDENYPLTFNWDLISKPDGSSAELVVDLQFATFVADLEGDYEIALTVTDQKGAISEPVSVIISTVNSAPIANAGPNQSFSEVGANITLDGSQSYDPDGEPITYEWVMIGKPELSTAALTAETSINPTFVADSLGTYTVELLVTDPHGRASVVDSVIITSENVPPVAIAGVSKVVFVGDNVELDGSGSYDANLDLLTYRWGLSVKPEGSAAELTDAELAYPSFTPDVQGVYTAILVVSDGMFESAPQAVDILAVNADDPFIFPLMNAIDAINALESEAFENINRRSTLITKLMTVLRTYIDGELVDQLTNDIANKMNGCYEGSTPDGNDWIVVCDAQAQIYPFIQEAIAVLTPQ